jgi:uncharacterized protein
MIKKYIKTSNGCNYYFKNNYISIYNKKEQDYIDRNINITKKIEFTAITPKEILCAFINTPHILFEITDQCNLNCTYCGYGRMYINHNTRNSGNMPFEYFKNVFKYFLEKWNSEYNIFPVNKKIHIGFYGGEPLLNFKFIQNAIDFLNKLHCRTRTFIFSMTTNALLLDKYMNFIVENNFDLLISLDGNCYNNSYRLDKNGKSVFHKVIRNIQMLKDKYPEYFNKKVNFNSVLHNKNSITDIYNYIFKSFKKQPHIGELNLSGINPIYKDKIIKMFRSSRSNYNRINDQALKRKILYTSPILKDAIHFLNKYCLNSYNTTFNNILNNENPEYKTQTHPTGTCIPFSRKVFITVTGNILPCERIGNKYSLGNISEKGINIDFTAIATYYNNIYKKYIKQCNKCQRADNCPICVLASKDAYKICHNMYNTSYKETYLNSILSFLESNPEKYFELINVILQ